MPGTVKSTCVHEETFTAVAASTTSSLWKYLDLSQAEALYIELQVTDAQVAAGDILSVRIEDTFDGTKWNERVRFANVLGNITEPMIQRATVNQGPVLNSTEEVLTTSGSASGSGLTAGTVQNGPFPNQLRTSAGPQPTFRINYTVTSASAPSFTGTIKINTLSRV
jgi:hypothetical protein